MPAPLAPVGEGLPTPPSRHEHGGHHLFPDWLEVQAEASVLFRARRRRAELSAKTSRCGGSSPGFGFTLDAHPLAELNQKFTVVSVRHRGTVGRDRGSRHVTTSMSRASQSTGCRTTRCGADGKRAGNQPFEVHGVGAEVAKGTSEADGTVRFEAPILCREAEVRFPKLGVVMPVHIGDLDPIDEKSGQKQRLRNLGYLSVGGEVSDGQLAAAFRALQRKNGIAVTGVADAATLDALASEHLS